MKSKACMYETDSTQKDMPIRIPTCDVFFCYDQVARDLYL